jgi:hypothetical protein
MGFHLRRPDHRDGDPRPLALISTTVNIRGESYRLKERRKAGLIPLPDQQQTDSLAATPNNRGKRSHSS